MTQWAVNFYMSDESAMGWASRPQDHVDSASEALTRAQEHFDEAIEGLTAVACDPLDQAPAQIPDEGTYAYQITDQSAARKR